MKKFKWAISCFVNVVFLFNTVIFDTSAAPTMMPRTGIDYLAPISLFNNLDDSNMELQDLSRIEYILTQHLFYAKDNEGDLDIEKFVEKASAYRDSSTEHKAPIQFFTHEKETFPDGLICLRCRIFDEKKGEPRTYYSVFPKKAVDGFFPMQVYTEKEWDKVRPEISGTKFPIRAKEKPAQAAALERNVAHQGFDSVLQFAHDPRSGITISSPEELGIDYQQILEDVQAKLGVTIENPNDLLPLEERVCSIIPMDGILKDAFEQNRIILNDVKGNKKSLIPFTHLSDYYQNILMKGEEIGALKRNTPEAAEIRERIKESLSRAIAHELGVACDQPILFFDDNDNPINIFDCMYQDIDMLRVPGEYREIKNSYELKDLDTNIETRDFAGSDKQSRSELRYRCEGKDGEKIEGCPIITDCSTNNRIDPFGSFGVSAYYKFDKYVIGEHEKKYNSKTYMFYIFDLEKGEFYGLCDKNDIVIESLPDIFQVMVKDGVMVVLSKDNKGPEPFCWITIRAYDLSTGQEILHSRRYDGYEYESFKLSARSIIVSRTSGHRYEANPPDIILHFNKISASRHLLDFEANKKQKDFEARLIRELTILCNKHADEQVGEKFFVYWGASPDSQGEGLEVDPKDFIFTSWYRGKRLAMERYVATEEGVLIIHEPEVDYRKERIFGYKKGNPLLNIGVSNSNERRWYFYVTKEFYDFLKSNNMLQKFNYTMESNYPRRNRTEDRLDLLRQGIYFLVEGQEPPEEIRLLVDEKDKPSKPSRRVGKKAPGKSPEAALQIIADDPSLQFKMFSEDDYLASYKTRYGKFKFEAPAPGKTLEDNESALRTVRRDLHEGADALARGNNPVLHVLQQNQAKEWVIVPVDKIERGKKIMYKLTDEGMRRTAPASVHKEKITPQEERRLALAETIAPKVLVYDQEKINSEFAKESLRVMNETLKEYLDKIIAYLILEAGTPAVDMNKMEVIKQVAIGSLERQHAVIKDAAAKKAHEELEKLMAGIAIDIVQTVRHDANALIREKILNPKFIEARLNEINYTAPGRAINAQEISMIPEMRDDLIARYFGIANVNFMLTDGFLRFLVNESTQKKVGGIVSGGSPVDALVLLAVATANPVDFTYLEHKDIITKEAFSSVSDRTLRRDREKLIKYGYMERIKPGHFGLTDKGIAVALYLILHCNTNILIESSEDNKVLVGTIRKRLPSRIKEYLDKHPSEMSMVNIPLKSAMFEFDEKAKQRAVDSGKINSPIEGFIRAERDATETKETRRLVNSLQSGSAFEVTKACDELANKGLRGISFMPYLRGLLKHSQEAVQRAASSAIKAIRESINKPVPMAEKTWGEKINEALESDSAFEVSKACEELGAIGVKAVPFLEKLKFIASNHPHEGVKQGAANTIENIEGAFMSLDMNDAVTSEIKDKAVQVAYDKYLDSACESMESVFKYAGLQMSTYLPKRYTLLMTEEFFAKGELKKDGDLYRDRFNLSVFNTQNKKTLAELSPEEIVSNIISMAGENPERTGVLIQNDLPAAQYERLTQAGIKFVPVNVKMLKEVQADKYGDKMKREQREKFRLVTYAAMLLVRGMDSEVKRDSPMYKALSFIIKTHFGFMEQVDIDAYVQAFITNKVPELIKGYLAYRPMGKWERPKYRVVIEALIKA